MKNIATIYTKMALMALMLLSASAVFATSDTVYAAKSILASGTWAKIRVATTGIHQLTSAVIKQAGFSDLSKVKIYGYGGNMTPDKLTPTYIMEHDDLKEVATCTVNGVKYFYANGPVSWDSNTSIKRTRNYCSNYGYYFITETSAEGLTCSEQDLYDQVTQSTFAHHFLYEKDQYAWHQTGRNLVDGTKITSTKPQTVNVIIPKGNTQAVVHLAITAASTSSYAFKGKSGEGIGSFKMETTYDKCKVAVRNMILTSSSLDSTDANGNFICPITISATTESSVLRLDYVEAYFNTVATPDSLKKGTYPVAEYSCNITNQNHHADKPADLIIIIPTNQALLTQAQALADYHKSHDNISTLIVPADELYNEFTSGTPDISAYKRYLKMFFDRAQATGSKMPKNVLLFGDAVWDNRMITLSTYDPDNYLLCHETEDSYNLLSSFSSDDFITALHDNETIHETSYGNTKDLTLDIGVGRIPVTSSGEAKVVVNKIKEYGSNLGEWQNEIFFFADDGDNGSHMANIDACADSVIVRSTGYYVKKGLADAYTLETTSTGSRYPALNAIIEKQQNNGALVMNYGGHASSVQLSDEMLVTLADSKAYKGDNYSLWFAAACETAPFDQTSETLGEQLVMNNAGGAIAFCGATRTVEEGKNSTINKAFMRYVLSYDSLGTPRSIGEALCMAKNSIITNVNKDGTDVTPNKHQYVIIGDPAMPLALPRYKAVIDKINGKATTIIDTIQGSSVVTLSGHVTDYRDTTATKFNGTAEVLVRDSRRLFTCRNNKGDTNVLKYYDRTNILYKGVCTVTNGQFSCSFRMPSDIYDDGGTGLVTVFAYDPTSMISAHGECGSFSAQGWQEAANDSIGPSIFAYLNNPSFQNGDAVGQTPFFVAEVSDNDGLSTTGMALGHNMELVVDGDVDMIYDLNDNFSYDSGSYTSGQTYYTLPELSPGSHSLTFTAWDILGNPNKVSLTFRVVKGVTPKVTHIAVSPNPITDEATFYVTHDMKGSEANINIDIIDLTGRIVQTLTWSDTFSETNSTSTYKWNPSGLSRGLYLYRVRVSSNGSTDAIATQKLILAQ